MRRYLLYWEGREVGDHMWLDVPGWTLQVIRSYATRMDKRGVDSMLWNGLYEVRNNYSVEEA